jgi:cysteine desulfurase
MIDLDHNATTPLCREAREAMLAVMEGPSGNPSSVHASGRRTRAVLDDARDRIAALLGARSHEIIFTSGGTESCNLAILGLARRHRSEGRNHLVTSVTEHHAVLHAMRWLAEHEGFTLTEVPVNARGMIDPEVFAACLRPETLLASVMFANNETGVIQPVDHLASLCERQGILFHTDAVQAFGKVPFLSTRGIPFSALSATAHKFYGPPGAGFLWLRSGVPINTIFHGGYHENNRRPGTENAVAIAGMAAAAEKAVTEVNAGTESSRQANLREALWEGIHSLWPSAIRNTPRADILPNTLNVSFPGCDGETLLMGLDLEGVAVSSGSACMVGSVMPSHVLLAMGVPEETARATVRFSLGRENTEEEISRTLAALGRVLSRQIRP